METYRLSKYNHFLVKEEYIVGVNLFNKYIFSIDREKYDMLISGQQELTKLQQNNSVLFNTMYKLGVIEEVDLDVPSILLMKNREQVYSNSTYRLIIIPTLNCNFSCWYCYETHNREMMSKDVINSIIRFVEKLSISGISRLHLDWFGGEPLMGYKTVMKPICQKIKEACDKNNIEYFSSMTTNGFLIKKEMIPFFEDYNIRGFQITLDGDKQVHNKTRCNGKNKQGSYDVIINNICLLSNIKNANIGLRINYTRNSIKNVVKIIDDFPFQYRCKIHLSLAQVWQDRSSNTTEDRNYLNKVEAEIYKKFKEEGFKVKNFKFICDIHYSCYADLKNEAVINYDGRIFKCTTADFEKSQEEGVLTVDGNIEWNEHSVAKRLSRATFDNDICLSCKYLPICSGGCTTNPVSEKLVNNECVFKPRLRDNIEALMNLFDCENLKIAHINQIKQISV